MSVQAAQPSPPPLLEVPSWALLCLLLPAAAIGGFVAGDNWMLAGAAILGLGSVLALSRFSMSNAVKLTFLLVAFAFLQRAVGYLKAGDVRGVNLGNLLLVVAVGYWVLQGVQRGKLYEPTPLDFWLFVWAVAFPVVSIIATVAFRDVASYSFMDEAVWYKQWVTPIIYFFLLCQSLQSKQDIRRLTVLVIFLVGLAMLFGLPEVLRFGSWRGGRSEGILQQANDYASLLAVTAPFFFLVVFLTPGRPMAKGVVIAMLGLLALSILTTYSRAGYVGFGLALAGSAWLGFRGTGRVPLLGPVLIMSGLAAVPFLVAPQLIENLQSRFELKTYRRAERQSYSEYRLMNQYAGDRLELWSGAIEMARKHPLTGVGFHAFNKEVGKYHSRGWYNYPHNQFLGALAEGGIFWLAALVAMLWRLLRLLYEGWATTLRQGDLRGQVVCGGALLCLIIMTWISLANDFFNPGPKSTIFWVIMAGAVRYGILAHEDPQRPEEGLTLGPGAPRAGPTAG